MVVLRTGPVTVGGVALDNHLILAAGVLGTTGASLSRMLARGAGGVVTKSIGPQPKDGHAGPCVALLDNGILNAMGLPNPSREFADELKPLEHKPAIVSIFGGNPGEFAEVAGWFKGKAAGFELNLSCPHAEGYGAAIGVDPALVEVCTRAVRALGMPTWVKLTPNVTDIATIGKAAERGGATAIVAIYTVAVRCVYELYEACTIPIIGCGGISTADNVIEMMMAGARAVEIGSAVQRDIGVFESIKNDLYAKKGVEPEEIVGCAHG